MRVVWLASQAEKLYAPKNGIDMSNLDYHTPVNERITYGASKAGNILYASEYAKRFGNSGVVSVVSLNRLRNSSPLDERPQGIFS